MPPGSSIVNVGSAAGLTGHYPVAYTAGKWALRGLSKAACVELGPRGIRVNTVHPGFIETEMTASAAPAFREANIRETPLARTGTVDEITPLVVFLVSDDAPFTTGAEIPVDGGHRTLRRQVRLRRPAAGFRLTSGADGCGARTPPQSWPRLDPLVLPSR